MMTIVVNKTIDPRLDMLINFVVDWTYGYDLDDRFCEDLQEFLQNELDIDCYVELEEIC